MIVDKHSYKFNDTALDKHLYILLDEISLQPQVFFIFPKYAHSVNIGKDYGQHTIVFQNCVE